jgi:23S rRNA (uracil1939-C5)-methyltransferase
MEDGKTVFVPRAACGDLAEVAIVEDRRRFSRARLTSLIEPGPGRTDPLCPHYVHDACGSCQLQHLSLDAQTAAKRKIVGDALRRIGRVRLDADPELVPAPEPWRYRARVSLAVAGGRIGYRPLGAPGRVFDLEDCHIARHCLTALWRTVSAHRTLLPQARVRVALREDRDGGRHVLVETADARAWDAAPLAAVVEEPDVAYWWHPAGGAPRVVAGPAGSFAVLAFEQVHPAFGDRIRHDALVALGNVDGQVVWDLYAGTGDAARILARSGANVWAVEADSRTVEWGSAHTAATDMRGAVSWRQDRVEDVIGDLPDAAAVVANPPRGGLAPAVTARLDALVQAGRCTRIAYVSCDPATLARDLTRLPHLRLSGVVAFDLFPQTAHVETLAVLEAA